MSQSRVNLNTATLEQLFTKFDIGRTGGLKKDIYSGISTLNVQDVSTDHRAPLTSVLRCILKEDEAYAKVATKQQATVLEDEARHENLRASFQTLTARVIARKEAAGELKNAQKALDDAKASVRAITAGITDDNIRGSIEGVISADIADDIDAIRWRIVLLSLLGFQASEAKLRCEINDRSAAFQRLRDRIEELDSLVKRLLWKPQNEHNIGASHDGLAGISSSPADSKKTLGFSGGRRY
ncbi:TPA: hypothetical protein ACOFCQ_000526 [Stenotrophomonas maltophilia]